MFISDLLLELADAIAKHGDIEVSLWDDGCNVPLEKSDVRVVFDLNRKRFFSIDVNGEDE